MREPVKIDSTDNELVRAFYSHFQACTVWIRGRRLEGDEQVWTGTGCIIGLLRNPHYEPKAIVVTAGHVLRKAQGTEVEWKVQRQVVGARGIRTAVFRTPHENEFGPRFVYYGKDPRVDIGALFVDARCTDGQPFFEWDEQQEPAEPLAAVIGRGGKAAGSRVAWAGYPGITSSQIGEPLLCYYEGVVSAVVDMEGQPPMYLLDGHNTWGLSGGPVWGWSDDRNGPELIGIVVSYRRHVEEETELPGHVAAMAIHPILVYFKRNYACTGLDSYAAEDEQKPPDSHDG